MNRFKSRQTVPAWPPPSAGVGGRRRWATLAAALGLLTLCGGHAAAAPACSGGPQPAWRDFYCRFMTVDRWEAAGRPDFTAPDGSRWQPWYYGDRSPQGNNVVYEGRPYVQRRAGLLEAMLKVGTLPDEYDPAYVAHYWELFRYAPWSMYAAHQAGCRGDQTVDPLVAAAAGLLPRAALLGMGDTAFGRDGHDPTAGLGPGALPALMRAAGIAPPPRAGDALCLLPGGP